MKNHTIKDDSKSINLLLSTVTRRNITRLALFQGYSNKNASDFTLVLQALNEKLSNRCLRFTALRLVNKFNGETS